MSETMISHTTIQSQGVPALPDDAPAWARELVDAAWSGAQRGEDITVTTAQELLTTAQAAQKLSLDPSTVWRMAKDGRLPAVKVGNRYKISAQAVHDYDASRMNRMLEMVADELDEDLAD